MISPAPLRAVVDHLGIGQADLSAAERPGRIAGTFPVEGRAVAGLSPALLDAFVAEYGGAARLTFAVGGLDELTVDGGYPEPDLRAMLARAPTIPTYDVVIQVDKQSLADPLATATSSCVVYLSHDAFLRELRAGAPKVEADLWPDPSRRLVVVLLESDVSASGPMLSLIGRSDLGALSVETARLVPDGIDVELIAERRIRSIGWDSGLDTRLTPWHVALEEASGDTRLLGQVGVLHAALTVLFTCDRARLIPRSGRSPLIQAEFRGHEHVAFVPLDLSATPPPLQPPQRTALCGLVDWCYQHDGGADAGAPDWLEDRLPFVQARVAQALEGRSENDRFAVFVASMPQILEGVRWHWRAFIEGRVSDYLDKVDTLETAVSGAVNAYSDRVNALVKALSDAMLAAVAALIGSFVAAAFADPFDAALFRIGMVTYAVYVLVFPCLIGLLAAGADADAVQGSFDAQRRAFDEALFPEKVEEVVGSRVAESQRRFGRWRVLVAVCYVVVAAATILGAIVVPFHVGGGGAAGSNGSAPSEQTVPE